MQLQNPRVIFAAILVSVGVIGRLLLQDFPNIETITVVSVVAGSLLGGVWVVLVGLLTVGISDMVIGNTNILLYTWSAWACTGLFGWFVRKTQRRALHHVVALTGAGLFANLFFFLWTNFGVWHIGGLYPHTLVGLLQSYINGLPFLRLQIISTILFVPTLGLALSMLWRLQKAPQSLRHIPSYERHS